MSMHKRTSPARRRGVLAGRARVALLVASTALAGGVGGVAVPAGAQVAGDVCNLLTATISADGECTTTADKPEATTVADTTADTTPAAPAEPDTPVTPTPGDGAGEAEPGTPATPEPAPASEGEAAPATPAADPSPQSVPTPAQSTAAAAAAAALPAEERATSAAAKDKAENDARPSRSERRKAKAARRKARRMREDRAERAAERDAAAEAADGHDHDHAGATGDVMASLPAEWTSLDPIPLPPGADTDLPIPASLLPLFQAAGAEYGVPWQVLASINEIETNFGENVAVSSAGALGWMQFMPSSWARWGVDADGDDRRDPRDAVDAIFAAARYLADHGADEDLAKAVFAYNHAGWYVERVLRRAREFASLDPRVVAAVTEGAILDHGEVYRAERLEEPTPGQALLLPEHALRRMVLHEGAADVYACGREDIEAGRVDRRVLAALVFLDREGLHPTVSSLECGHGRMTASGNVSAHSYGHAVDVAAINGTSINGNQGAGSITEEAVQALVRLQGALQPNQIISLMTIDGHPNTISMGDHADHIHVGFPRTPAPVREDRA